MKKKEKQALRGMSDQELVKHVAAIEAEIAKGTAGRVFRTKRKNIAVAKTMLRERTL